MDFDNPKVYGDTSITDGLVTFGSCDMIYEQEKPNKQKNKKAKNIWYVLGISEYIPVQQLIHKNMLRKGNVVVFTEWWNDYSDIFLSKGKLFIN